MREFCAAKIVNILRYIMGWNVIIIYIIESPWFSIGDVFCRKIGDTVINQYF